MNTKVPFLLTLGLFFLYSQYLTAGIKVGEDKKLNLYGDVRLRAEMDMDSDKSTKGQARDDRDRLRFRLRFGFDYQHSDHFSFGGRLRSGSAASAQSPHSTMGDGFIPKTVNIDKAYIKGNYGSGFYWFGKNSFHFWKQNELFWDDDVTPEGFALSHTFKLGENSGFTANGGYFVLDGAEGSFTFGDQAKMIGAQAALKTFFGEIPFQAAAGIFNFNENSDSTNIDAALSDLNYNIIVIGANLALKNFPLPVKVGFDFMTNTEDYKGKLFNDDQTTGYVGSIKVGGLKNGGDWHFAYYFAHIEQYAIVANFAQDDWLRWGSATVARSSNFQGHEFRIARAISGKSNLVLRVYLVEGIKLRNATATQKETGTRARLDWNIKF